MAKETRKKNGINEILPQQYDLIVIQGPYTGEKYHLKPDLTRIGRDAKDNDIVIEKTAQGEVDYTISRRQATIKVKNGCYYLRDEKSKNGTFLNSQRLQNDEEHELRDGDEIKIKSQYTPTIFRVVPASAKISIAEQKKAGAGSYHRPARITMVVSVLLFVAGVIAILSSIPERSGILKESDSLSFTDTIFKADEIFNQPSKEIFRISNLKQLMPSPALVPLEKHQMVSAILVAPDGGLIAWSFKENKRIWSIEAKAGVATAFSITPGDLNNDGLAEILVSGLDSRVHAFDSNFGNPIWKSDYLGGKLASQPSIGDLNGDGVKDVVVCSEEGIIHCGIASEQQINWHSYEFGNKTKAIPAIADYDGDGQSEILVGTEIGLIFIFTFSDKDLKVKSRMDVKNSINNAIASSGLYSEQSDPVCVITTRQYDVFSFAAANFNAIGSDKLVDPRLQWPMYYASPLLFDINRDQVLEVVVTAHNGEIILYQLAENPDNKLWTFQPDRSTAFLMTPALVDLNNDNTLDIIACDTLGTLYVVNGRTGEKIFEDASPQASFSASPVVGDVNGDGYIDVVAVDNNYTVHLYQSTNRLFKNAIYWDQHAGIAEHSGMIRSGPGRRVFFSNNVKIFLGGLVVLAVVGYWLAAFTRRKRANK